MKIQFVDLAAAYQEQKSEIDSAVQKVLENGNFILGSPVSDFERSFADYCSARHCIGIDNGTNALEIALRAIGVREDDEVIIPCNTFIATALAVSAIGAKPVLVDVNEHTFLMDLSKIEASITKRTRCIIPVHLFGQLVNMDAVWNIARSHQIMILEDACQAHGASGELKAGTIGAAACYSFYPAKNLGCAGDGGAITTNIDSVANKIRSYRNYGSREKYFHEEIGTNARLDSIHAAILNIKLSKLDEWNERRNKAATMYNEMLREIGDIETPKTSYGNYHVYHLYVIKTHFRDKLQEYLKENGIPTQIHYPIPIHKQKCYPEFNKLSFPVTEKLAKTMLSLPMHPHLTAEQIEFICDTIKKFFKQKNIYGERTTNTADIAEV